jgi:hypothetical protein
MHLCAALAFATVTFAAAAFAQDSNVIPDTPPDAFQVRYSSNLNRGDAVINVTNTGSDVPNGDNLCINVYTFDQSAEMVSCCSCLVTPDGLVSLSVQGDLISNTISPSTPVTVVTKLVATRPFEGDTLCDPSQELTLAPGMRAWGTTLHALPGTPTSYALTETDFLRGGLSAEEYFHLTSLCGFIKTNGSGFGICKSCRTGGLAGARQ